MDGDKNEGRKILEGSSLGLEVDVHTIKSVLQDALNVDERNRRTDSDLGKEDNGVYNRIYLYLDKRLWAKNKFLTDSF